MSLTFNARNHSYRLDGKPIQGVTTLIGKGWPKPALPYWSAKCVAEYVADDIDGVEQLRKMGRDSMVNALKGVPWQKRDEAAVRGTAVHALAEQVIHGRDVEVPDHLLGHVEGYVRWLDDFGVQPILTERKVLSRQWGYAGTFDAIIKIGSEVLLVDIKTSKAVYGDISMQVAAYANAEAYIDDDGSEQPLPAIDGLGVVHVTEYGTTFHRFTDPAAAWKCFRHVSWVAKQVDVIKAQLGDPESAPVPSEEITA